MTTRYADNAAARRPGVPYALPFVAALVLLTAIATLYRGVYTSTRQGNGPAIHAYASPEIRTRWLRALGHGDPAEQDRMLRQGSVIVLSGPKPIWFWYQPPKAALGLTRVRIVQGPHFGRTYLVEGKHLNW